MRCWKGWLCGLAVALLMVAPAGISPGCSQSGDREGKPKPRGAEKKAGEGRRGEYAIMASECKLTDQQNAKLEAAVKAKKAALEEWETANSDRLKEIQAKMAEAKRNNIDEQGRKPIADEMRALRAGYKKIEAEHNAKILAVLTQDQRRVWEGFKTYRGMMNRYRQLDLTEQQRAKTRALCNEAGMGLMASQGEGEEAGRAKSLVRTKLARSIEEQVLTDDQRAKLKERQQKPRGERRREKEEDNKSEHTEAGPRETENPQQ